MPWVIVDGAHPLPVTQAHAVGVVLHRLEKVALTTAGRLRLHGREKPRCREHIRFQTASTYCGAVIMT